ncbi:hypothetical protein TRFO_40564 [Tritrichomonas foetus]|uniref:SH3 domain-containing protein n=1 Tax=Tritrichomonas foetus TaxID=1144522 RepID=A0A1J4J626_9EUKA|nr:hypothetical protein TRFO_40564 [Tritrichomonas foetus]|eukprot:OHS93115.1 hypothetical protein TRFO_40564 [Tritrichomonas foetus]
MVNNSIVHSKPKSPCGDDYIISMAEGPNYSTYAETHKIMNSTYLENYNMMKQVGAYLQKFNGQIESIIVSLENLSMVTSSTRRTDAGLSQFSQIWRQMKDNALNPIENFKYTESNLREIISKQIIVVAEQYKSKMEDLIKKSNMAIQKLETIKKQAEDAHTIYMQSGNNLKNGFENQTNKIHQLKEDFVRSQNIAFELHKKLNEERALFCDEFESFLTDFEQIEQWRIEHLKEAYIELAGNIDRTAALFHTSASQISFYSNEMDPESDSKLINDSPKLKNSICSPLYQIIPVSSIATNHLDMNDVFSNEIQNGGKIGHAQTDFIGTECDQLDIFRNESVVVLSEEGDQYLCKNINECIGFVPKSIIKIVDE